MRWSPTPPSQSDETATLCLLSVCAAEKKRERSELHQPGKLLLPNERQRDVRYGWDRKSRPISQSSCFEGDSSMGNQLRADFFLAFRGRVSRCVNHNGS